MMTAYLILVLLVLQAQPGETAPTAVLERAYISASSLAVCQAHADKMAEAQRRRHADAVRRMQAKVVASCELLKGAT